MRAGVDSSVSCPTGVFGKFLWAPGWGPWGQAGGPRYPSELRSDFAQSKTYPSYTTEPPLHARRRGQVGDLSYRRFREILAGPASRAHSS